MKDSISHTRLLTLHPKVRDSFRSFIEEAENELNIKLRITSALRTFAAQQELYNQGRTTPGKIVTKAKPGSSFHNYGLAVDLVRLDGTKADWSYEMSNLLPYAKKYGIDWGGSWKKFKDYPHFEKTFGYSHKQLLAKHNAKEFIDGSTYVEL
jgi:peptidoglycan LD-endopeptidase CwlK